MPFFPYLCDRNGTPANMRQWGFREWWVQNVKEQHFTVDDER